MTRMRSTLFALAILLAASPLSPAQTHTETVCAAATAQPLQPPDLPGPLSPTQLRTCDEQALYYGFSTPPNYPAALQCGWYQQAHPQNTVGNMFYGEGVLTMLYANGLAIPKDTQLAIRLACQNSWAAPAETQGRVAHLEALATSHAQTAKFDLCDDITSGLSMGSCEMIRSSFADPVRTKKLQAISSKFPAAIRPAFLTLQAAESAFEDARTGNEIDLSGTARAMFAIQEQTKLRDQFLINLQRFGTRDIPPASSADLATLEARLNTTYQQVLALPPSVWQDGTIKPQGIRTTQQTWQALTQAWLNFARLAYPDLSPARIHAQLIRLRLHQLRSLKPA
jgi:hypothetical protein